MTTGRKITYEERMEMVEDCLRNGQNYCATAEKFDVSYQQIYGWVKKYDSRGVAGLKDYRGRGKPPEDMNDTERLEAENKLLRAQIVQLELELKVKKITRDPYANRTWMSKEQVAYQPVRGLSIAGEASVSLLCELTHVSRSGYYKWLRRAERASRVEDDRLCATILEYHLKYKGILGYRRMTMYIYRDYGKTYNRKRIRRWMRFLRLQSVIRRKRRRYLHATPEVTAENLLNREFTAEKPNQKWLTDVTELKHGKDQKAYLSAILDFGDNSIVSYIVGHKNNNDLVFRTCTLAVAEKQPLFHSDRGYQYTSKAFPRMLKHAGCQQSMSRAGRCLDNGTMKGFWGTLKSEMYVLNTFST